MAGQHYLPQFLLKGFTSRTRGKNHQVWCFKRNKPPFEPNTLNIGLEGEFYGKSGKGSLDKFITEELENAHQQCVNRMRKNPTIISSTDERTLIDFVHSLVLRSKHLREISEKGVRALLEEGQQIFTDVNAIRRLFLTEVQKNSPIGDSLLTTYIRAKYGKQTSEREKFLKWAKKNEFKQFLLRDPEAGEGLRQLAEAANIEFPPLFEQLGPLVKSSHNDALKKGLQIDADERSARYVHYLQKHWRVQTFENGSLILGDVAVMQFEQKAETFSAAYDSIDEDVLFLPLSHNLLVIGSSEDAGPLPSPQEINRHSAALSIDYFVSSQNSEQERAYQELLGSRALQFPNFFQ